MKKIRIFLASSNELLADREHFEIEIYRKCKLWIDKGIFLHLDIWEDATARMSPTASQDEYNKIIQQCDLFVLLAHTKVGPYTHVEFITAQGQFLATRKPFIWTYFKQVPADFDENTADAQSLRAFQQKLKDLKHFYSPYASFEDLWMQFNKELDRLEAEGFVRDVRGMEGNAAAAGKRTITQGDKSIYIKKGNNTTINIQ
jgi:hypothetical protein